MIRRPSMIMAPQGHTRSRIRVKRRKMLKVVFRAFYLVKGAFCGS